jgi:hypothetical protein
LGARRGFIRRGIEEGSVGKEFMAFACDDTRMIPSGLVLRHIAGVAFWFSGADMSIFGVFGNSPCTILHSVDENVDFSRHRQMGVFCSSTCSLQVSKIYYHVT